MRKWGGRIIGRDGGRVGEGEGRIVRSGDLLEIESVRSELG